MEQNFIAAVGTFTNTRKCTTTRPTTAFKNLLFSTYSIKEEFSQVCNVYNEARTAAPSSFRLFLRRVKRPTPPSSGSRGW